MDEATAGEPLLDLKDLEMKIGRKTPDGLMKWMREDPLHRAENKLSTPERHDRDPNTEALVDKIKDLKQDMLYLRSMDVRILRQLVALHEGIESVKWLLEDRGALASRCSSLTSSQYSLAEGPDTSLRGSWSSLHDPGDRLDAISVGSYLDTLADDTDEYCPSGSEAVVCSTPLAVQSGAGVGSPLIKPGGSKEKVRSTDTPSHNGEVPTSIEAGRLAPVPRDVSQRQGGKVKGVPEKADGDSWDSPQPCLPEKLSKNPSPKVKAYQNGKVHPEGCKLNSKVHVEFDTHWRWVQSQDDVTFL